MFLKHRQDDSLVELLQPAQLWDPFTASVQGRFHAGEELQDPQTFAKADLLFLSNEPLPRCWLNPHYLQSMGAGALAMPSLGLA
jgi:hypothetical protein